MKQYQAMKKCSRTLRRLALAGVSMTDVLWLEVYEEWLRLKREGHKVTYIVYYLSDQYGLSEMSVYRLVKRMERKV